MSGGRADFSYADGKRAIESLLANKYQVPSIAIRFPVVIGANDYTQRLRFYSEHIKNGEPFAANDYEEKMSFITEEDAGNFICELVESDFLGPINAACIGEITVKEIIELIEEVTGKKAKIDQRCDNKGPYSTFGGVTQNIDCALKITDNFEEVRSAFKRII